MFYLKLIERLPKNFSDSSYFTSLSAQKILTLLTNSAHNLFDVGQASEGLYHQRIDEIYENICSDSEILSNTAYPIFVCHLAHVQYFPEQSTHKTCIRSEKPSFATKQDKSYY